MGFKRGIKNKNDYIIDETDLDHIKDINQIVNKIIRGDALEVLKKLPSNSIDVVFTDPPFFVEDKYGVGSYKSYKKALPEIKRIMKKDSWLFIYFPSNKLDILLKDTTDFLEYVDRFVVDYVSTTTKGAFGDKRTLELCVFRKGVPKVFERFFSDIILGIEDPVLVTMHPKNPMWKPTLATALILRKIVGTSENKIVLDPFMGYGSILFVASKLGFKWIGIDVNEEYLLTASRILYEGANPRELISRNNTQTKPKDQKTLGSFS